MKIVFSPFSNFLFLCLNFTVSINFLVSVCDWPLTSSSVGVRTTDDGLKTSCGLDLSRTEFQSVGS